MSTYPNIIAAKDARIAELEAEVERLRRLVMAQSRAIHSPEALSRTGAVMEGMKQAATIILAQIDSKPDWTPEQEGELRKHDPVDTARAAARVAIKQCHRAILSALEPAAQEGQQEAGADAVRFLYKHGALTHIAAREAVELLTSNGFEISRRPE